jgi:hypothetical protein
VTNSQTPAVPPDWPSRCSPQGMKQRRNRGTPCSWWLPKMTRMTLWIICGLEIEYENFIDSYLFLNSHLLWQTNKSELVNNQRLPVIFWTLLRVSPLRVDIRTSCTTMTQLFSTFEVQPSVADRCSYIYICSYICYVHIYVRICSYMFIYMFMYIYIYSIYIYMFMYICYMFIYMFIYIYICSYIYVHIYICSYIRS